MQQKSYIGNLIGALLLLTIGAVFIAAAVIWALDTHEFMEKAKVADGVVIVTKHAKSHPRIEYTEASGTKRWFLANDWLSGRRIFGFKDGEHVRVFYNSATPARTYVDGCTSTYILLFLIGLVGVLIVNLGRLALSKKTIVRAKGIPVAILLLTFGSFWTLFSINEIMQSRELISKAMILDGVVIAPPEENEKHLRAHPRIEYTTPTGEKDWVPANGDISYELGEHVRVLYDPTKLAHSKIDDFGSLYFDLTTIYYLGIPFFVLGILAILGIVDIREGR